MWTNSAPRFHASAWLLWLTAAMLAAFSTRNPIYLLLIMAAALFVSANLGRTGTRDVAEQYFSSANPQSSARKLLMGTVVGLTVAVALLKGISLHLGTTVLFRLPDELPVVGGPITLEAIISSALDGLSLLTVLAVFAAFSAGADYYAILRSVLPFLHQVGLITSIAITFVPKTVERFAEIREAQALRGHRVRRLVDLLPLIIPLLAGGMERSMNLAEAMEARGFSRSPASSRHVRPVILQIGLAASMGLILIGGTIPMFTGTIGLIGWATVTSGIGGIAVSLWAIGRRTRRERYRRSVWRGRDTALSSLSIGIIGFVITYRFLAASALDYYPFPNIYPPEFDPALAGALTGLVAPILLLKISGRKGPSGRKGLFYGKQFRQISNYTPYIDPAGGAGTPDPAPHIGHVRERTNE